MKPVDGMIGGVSFPLLRHGRRVVSSWRERAFLKLLFFLELKPFGCIRLFSIAFLMQSIKKLSGTHLIDRVFAYQSYGLRVDLRLECTL
jgi:hypothetical protein